MVIFLEEIADDGLVLKVFRLAFYIIKVVFGQTACIAVTIAKFLQIINGDEFGKSWIVSHERVGVQIFFERRRTFLEGIVQQMAVVGCSAEITIKQFLEQVDVGTLSVKHGLPVKIVLDDFLATIGTDTQTDSGNLITVVVLHIFRLDVGHFAADGVLDGVDVAHLAAPVNLVEMLHHVAVDDFLGINDLPVNSLVGGSFHTDGRRFLFKIRNVFLLLRNNDFDVVSGIG